MGTTTSLENRNNVKKDRPMYKNLRTNLPKEIMGFREKPFLSVVNNNNNNDNQDLKHNIRSYVTHKDVMNYLNDYCNDYDLNQYIKYNCYINQLTFLDIDNNDDNNISTISPSN